MFRIVVALAMAFSLSLATESFAQDSAPSSHMVFDDNFDGDIIVNQVRVPAAGVATYTYYETLGWRGLGAGYAGIQAHPKANNFIFSIWDNKAHKAPIRAVHRGPGTKTEKFGGEGTGLKSWNFELGWKPDTWYTLVARNWAVDDHRHFGFWVRADDTGHWTHLVTMDVAASDAVFQGGTDAFIEDWLNTGKHVRTSHLKGGWKRKPSGDWHAFGAGRYSVNHWDLVEGKRSFNFRTNWDGGTKSSEDEKFYFMTAGGAETRPASENPSKHTIARKSMKPKFPVGKIENVTAQRDGENLKVTWSQPATSTPQYAYHAAVYDNREGQGKPLASVKKIVPHVRSAEIHLKQSTGEPKLYLHFSLTDIFDQASKTSVVGF